MKKIVLSSLVVLVLLSTTTTLFSQTPKPLDRLVEKARQQNFKSESFELFSLLPEERLKSVLLPPELKEKTLLSFNRKQNNALLEQAPEFLELSVPTAAGLLALELVRHEIVTEDFMVVTDKSDGRPVAANPGIHYRGIVKGKPGSLVALSVFADELMGLISTPGEGNLNLGKVDQTDAVYVIFNDKELEAQRLGMCGTSESEDDNKTSMPGESYEKAAVKCVKVYIETDYDIYIKKGSYTGVTTYVAGLFNQVATLFYNDSIKSLISQLYVWTSSSPYGGSTSLDYLSDFKTYRTSFHGDIAHLLNRTGNLGGRAYVDILCNPTFAYAFSSIYDTYSTIPTYSWSVEVFAHEMGHNLGSKHTQSCTWPVGAIDNCVAVEDGSCSPGPTPTTGGTIMSYCHLTGWGINFSHGFGLYPRNRIRSEVDGATCLTTCESTAGGSACTPPEDIWVEIVTDSSFYITWSFIPAATSYTLRYRKSGTSAWTTITVPPNGKTVYGLAHETTYECEVRANCGSTTTSSWSATKLITTLKKYCGTKGDHSELMWIKYIEHSWSGYYSENDSGYADHTFFSFFPTYGSNIFKLTPGFVSVEASVENLRRLQAMSTLFLGKSFRPEIVSIRTPNGVYYQFKVPVYWKIWIDYNKDIDFDDPGELVYTSVLPSDEPVIADVFIPYALLGKTRMRITMSATSDATPCDTSFVGEAEDYTLNKLSYFYSVSPDPYAGRELVDTNPAAFKLIPNPSDGHISVEFLQEANFGVTQLQIIDITGKIVRSQTWQGAEKDVSVVYRLDMSDEPKGIYFVNIISENGARKTQKLSLQ